MALDFPSSPATGATYTSGGVTWSYDGTKWIPGQLVPAGGALLVLDVSRATGQTPGASVWAVCQFTTVNSDPENAWTAATWRYTPTKAGIYLVTNFINVNSAIGGLGGIGVYLNGALATPSNSVCAGLTAASVAMPVQCNGTTDYLQGVGYSSANAFIAGAAMKIYRIG